MLLQDIVSRHFRRLHARKQKEIVENVQVVVDQVKPSYLFDACAVTEECLQEFVLELKRHFPPVKLVKVVNEDFGCDFFIGHHMAMLQAINKAMHGETYFIETPLPMDILRNVFSVIQEAKGPFVELEPSGGQGPAIYGVLLGFNFVYCQPVEQSHELSKLIHVKATRNNVVVSSFTVPQDLIASNTSARASLDKWKLTMSSKACMTVDEIEVTSGASMSM